jgi:hypothetical protein
MRNSISHIVQQEINAQFELRKTRVVTWHNPKDNPPDILVKYRY